MPKYVAHVNITIGVPGKKHITVQKGDSFDVAEDYFKKHLESQNLASVSVGADKTKRVEVEASEDAEPESKPAKKKK